MTTVAIFNIFVVLFSYLARYKGYEYLLKVPFFLIFLFLALRYDYGNDYHAYLQDFLRINMYGSIDYSDETEHSEAGWLFLYRLFKPLGFFSLVAVLAAFNCFVYYRFIKNYVSPSYYWFAVFLYVFNPYFMLVHSSAMRQSTAICLFLFSIDYLYKKNAIRYFLCIGLASLLHSSALILLPLYLLGIFEWKINRTMAFIIFAVYILLFLIGESFMSGVDNIISAYFNRYETYLESEESLNKGSGLGMVLSSAVFVFVLYYDYFQTKQTSILFKIAILSYIIVPIALNLAMISRIGMYFLPACLVVFSTITLNIKHLILKIVFVALIVFITIYSFYSFFQSDTYSKPFDTYRTIFSAPEFF